MNKNYLVDLNIFVNYIDLLQFMREIGFKL